MSALKDFPRIEEIIYGPLSSRRLGVSLGVNVLPLEQKQCSFNCAYCQLGWTLRRRAAAPRFPTPAQIGQALREQLRRLRREKAKLDRITFSGNGEPTSHPQFEEIVKEVASIRDDLYPGVWIAVLTNGAHLDRPDVVRGLNQTDERIVKLDAGNEPMFRRLNKPDPGVTLRRVVDGMSKLRSLTLQTMFVAGTTDNSTPDEVESWLAQVERTRPSWLQLYSLDRVPADRKLVPVSRVRLMEISMLVSERCGLEPLVIFPEG